MQSFVIGSVKTADGLAPQVSSELSWADHWGTVKARWGVGRMHYKLDPGLYALGQPDRESPVVVTANYKMSFDRLRESLPGRSLWILVLDTGGINVWCAAGKGTFGTEEMAKRIQSSGLDRIVSHRNLIVPQLGAPGVSAHQVKKLTGFKVIYGPIRARDLPRFIDAGFKATSEMRAKSFPLGERAALIPVELVGAFKTALLVMPALFLLGGIGGPNGYWANATEFGLYAVIGLLSGVLAGAVLTPLLLPWLPGRAFSVKGLSVGLATAAAFAWARGSHVAGWGGLIECLSWLLLIPAVAAYLAMNFTGCSTYTSLSGVKKEMRWWVPLEIGATVVGMGLWLASRFIS